MRDAKEPGLALAHTLGLGLDVHADAIAGLVLDDARRTTRLLSLLAETPSDELLIRSAIERAHAVRDVTRLPPKARQPVARLLALLGHPDVARAIQATEVPGPNETK